MRLPLGAVILGGLFLAAALLALVVGDSALFLAVSVGGLMPLTISVVSLVVFFRLLPGKTGLRKHDQFVLLNFLAKVVLIAVGMTAVLVLTNWSQAAFVISLLVNFLAWHLYEAFRYQQYHLAAGRRHGVTT
jgi:amino acid transporter